MWFAVRNRVFNGNEITIRLMIYGGRLEHSSLLLYNLEPAFAIPTMKNALMCSFELPSDIVALLHITSAVSLRLLRITLWPETKPACDASLPSRYPGRIENAVSRAWSPSVVTE
jgi:hypothetical protein